MRKTNLKGSSSNSHEFSDHGGHNVFQLSGFTTMAQSIHALIMALDNSDEINILIILNQLSIELAIIQEDLLAAFPLDPLITALVTCLQIDHFPDIVLQAISCLMTMLDTLPNITGLFIARGGIGVLTTKLANFEFIDIAEQAIKLIEKISYESTSEIIMERVFENLVNTLEFYDKDTQKRIWSIIVNIAKSLTSHKIFLQYIVPILPNILSMMIYRGADHCPQTESAIDFFIALLENLARLFSKDLKELKSHLQSMGEQGILNNILGIVHEVPALEMKIFKLLGLICRCSSTLSINLINLGIGTILKEALEKESDKDYFLDALQLIDAILPEDLNKDPIVKEKAYAFRKHTRYIRNLGEALTSSLILCYETCIDKEEESLIVNSLVKIFLMAHSDYLMTFTNPQALASFLSEVLHSSYPGVILSGLKIVNICYDKIPQEISELFIREGIVYKAQLLNNYDKQTPQVNKQIKFFGEENMRQSQEDWKMPRRINRAGTEPYEPLSTLKAIAYERGFQKNEIKRESTSIIAKADQLETKKALRVGKDLKKLARKLSQNESAEEIWSRLIEMIEGDKCPSYFEFSNSGLVENIWRWFSEGDLEDNKSCKVFLWRLQEFLHEFIKENDKGEYHLITLMRLIEGAGNYDHKFVEKDPEPALIRPSIKELTQKTRLVFDFAPNEAEVINQEYKYEMAVKMAFFAKNSKFHITTENSIPFDEIKAALLMVKDKEELNVFKNVFKKNATLNPKNLKSETISAKHKMLINPKDLKTLKHSNRFEVPQKTKPKPDEIEIITTINGQEVESGLCVYDLLIKYGRFEEIKFRFSPPRRVLKECKFLSDSASIYKDLIKESQKTGLDINDEEKIIPYLSLLKFFYKINSFLPLILSPSSLLFKSSESQSIFYPIHETYFKSNKISMQLSRHLQEENSDLPSWAASLLQECKFLVPYPIKLGIFRYIGIEKMSSLWKEGVPNKQKIKINREKLLENAMFVMSDATLLKMGPIEFEYENEVGTGLGPTLEFYSLVGKAIRNLRIWRNSGEELGLFPSPLQSAGKNVLKYFSFLGRLVGKSLLDEKQLDLPLSPVFWKLIMNENITINDILSIDKTLGKTLFDLYEIVNKRNSSKDRKGDYTYKGARIKDLGLTFTLPGYDEIELKPNGKNIYLTLHNLEEYINLVAKISLMQESQATAFREGLDSVIPYDLLKGFTGEELETMICGEIDESWDIDTLKESIVPDHGYTHSSSTIQNLLIIMSQFSSSEKRIFLQFVTGSPRLPIGGFPNLSPKLTVVKKEPSMIGAHPDEYLPSVMTCQNYLKIPEYSTFEVLQRNLKYAMEEGHEAFHLS